MQVWRVTPEPDDTTRGRILGPLLDAPCALGRGGVTPEGEKTEGDGKTPIGSYPFRRVFYRPDKMTGPACSLKVEPLSAELGWCDDPVRAEYNRLVRLPFGGSHETLWRDDEVYDLILEIGHNDDPPVPGKGSAIFVHVARPDFRPTEGCVALTLPALTTLIRAIRPGDRLEIG